MINAVIGLMNSGKTLYMVLELFKHYMSGKEIITNFDLNFPHRKINKDFLTWLGKEQPVLENVAIGLDELWIWVDSRRSSKDSNLATTYFFNQSSKDDTPIYFTAQHNGQIDKRIRDNLQVLTQCSRVVYIDNKMKPIDENKRFLPKEIQKRLYIKIVEFRRVNIGIYTDMIPSKPSYIKASVVFPLYDTKQKIKNEQQFK